MPLNDRAGPPALRTRARRIIVWLLPLAMLGCGKPAPSPETTADASGMAAKTTAFANPEPGVPAQCYTRTDGVSNPCWSCHTTSNGRNEKGDWALQVAYSFSEPALNNHWTNLFKDRRKDIAAISDQAMQAYIGTDNYQALYRQARQQPDRQNGGYRPDLDYSRGFDALGHARDGSGWRAFRYKPLSGGGFWPTNGITDDLLIRLPLRFRQDARGRPSREIYNLNLAILEAAMTVSDQVPDTAITRRVEPVSEKLAGTDLDGDGRLALTDRITGLPARYAGGAAGEPVRRWLYPQGTEFLHSVRYIDPSHPGLLSRRLKELRYSVKRRDLSLPEVTGAYLQERDEKAAGLVPRYQGNAERGLDNIFGWTYEGWIEDSRGELRKQSLEEHHFCMGCHAGLGITADSSFGFPRKLPGTAGWGWQSLAGMQDVPMAGHSEPEYLTWIRRARGGDAFRSNQEIRDRFFPGGHFDEAAVRRAAPGGDRDLRWLIAPSPERAAALNKAYMTLVREQDYRHGRDIFLQPPENVHRRIDNGDTGLGATGQVYSDARIWLDWPETETGTARPGDGQRPTSPQGTRPISAP